MRNTGGRRSRIVAAIAACVLACAMAISASGCSDSSSQSATPGFQPMDVTIASKGFALNDDGSASYAFIAVNPNDGHLATNVVFSIEGYDDQGQMIAGGGATIGTLYPGVETPADGTLQLVESANNQTGKTPELAQLVVTTVMDTITWTDTKVTSDQVNELVDIQNPRYTKSAGGGLHAASDVVCSPDVCSEIGLKAQSIEVRTVVICEDEDGMPICGGAVETLTVDTDGEPVGYSTEIENVPNFASCSIYATPITVL